MALNRREIITGGMGVLVCAQEDGLRRDAREALRRAASFYREQVGFRGGFVWRYSDDLKKREGEGIVTEWTAWVQPPGTPTVGSAFLRAFTATSDRYFLDAAVECAHALVRGQLESGGWTYRMEFDGDKRNQFAYRSNHRRFKGRNVSTLDDDTTQSAIRFLMEADSALRHENVTVSSSVSYALDRLLKVQLPCGAWPQGYEGPAEANTFPARRASFPAAWTREYVKTDYWKLPTLNDGNLDRLVETQLLAERHYGTGKYRSAALIVGEFLCLAQMPDPQPAWAQQYSGEMQPCWARKFEPPAISGGESQGALRTLLSLYEESADKALLEPIPRALEYLRRSRLRDGRLARFYELRTNRPLYFNKRYELTYSDDDLPTHYAFHVKDGTDAIEKSYNRVKSMPRVRSESVHPKTITRPAESEVRRVIQALDSRGAWVESGRLRFHGPTDETRRIIDSATFAANLNTLSAYLAPSK